MSEYTDKLEWHQISARPMDEEERREWSEILGYDIEYDDAMQKEE